MLPNRTQMLRSSVRPAARLLGYARPGRARGALCNYSQQATAAQGTLPQDAFYIVNLAHVVRQHERWVKELPRVTPYYAVKCNGDRKILETLAALGCGFDCASPAEIAAISQLPASATAGRRPDIIYANPCKQIAHMEYATEHNIGLTTFDSAEELEKMAVHMPNTRALLRLLPDDSHAICRFGEKYGAPIEDAEWLLRKAKALGVEVAGVSYHVGSGNYSTAAYADAVALAREAFDIAANLGLQQQFRILDLGGGYPGDVTQDNEAAAAAAASTEPAEKKALAFEAIAAATRDALDVHFPAADCDAQGIRIIAEPGRYYVLASHMLLANVIGRKATRRRPADGGDQKAFKYYINDGIYGSFNCLLYDHATAHPRPLLSRGSTTGSSVVEYESSVWGQTCDGLDCVAAQSKLPELQVGDWLAFDNMGAYTTAASSAFNGFRPPPVSIYTYDGEIVSTTEQQPADDGLVRCSTSEALIDRLLDESPSGPSQRSDEKVVNTAA